MGDLIFCQKTAQDVMHERAHCHDEAANHQWPIALQSLNHLNSFCGGMFKLNAKFEQMHCSTHSVILNAMATQYTCSLNGVFCPHWPLRWSHHSSNMHIPLHCPWLPGYMYVMQTVLDILTMARLLLERHSCVCVHTHTHIHIYIYMHTFLYS